MIVKTKKQQFSFYFLMLFIVLCIFSSCAGKGNTAYFSQRMKDFTPTPGSKVIIYEDIPQDSFLRIGYVYTPPFDGEPGGKQDHILKKAAGRMGAHAIYELQPLEAHHYTYARDPYTPFPSFRNVRKDRIVLRATVIRFLEEDTKASH